MSQWSSNVNYVEPNLFVGFNSGSTDSDVQGMDWAADSSPFNVPRAPRLEDYCIVLNIEVEISKREKQAKAESGNDVIILSYRSEGGDGTRSKINFMGGTKIECSDVTSVNYLTTNYADMYVGDLVDYGTTEMIGIKSVDIQYKNSTVPIITIQFTDVRGMSLFQPKDLNQTESYNSIVGIDASNVAQTFFQCFFMMPRPKFTIFLKGFYGEPVSYQVVCDKFDTKFDASRGDFDCTARFIGYTYSFLTDVSVDTLLAAPYSDYEGKKYWEERHFTINNKAGAPTTMPTLVDILYNIKSLKKGTSSLQGTTIDQEEVDHSIEISKLNDIKDLYRAWYSQLEKECVKKYTEKYCFPYVKKFSKDDPFDYDGMLILATADSKDEDLSQAYSQFSTDFKKIHSKLLAAINEFNEDESAFKKLSVISEDFSDYKKAPLFYPLSVNYNSQLVFTGFRDECTLNKTKVRNHVFVNQKVTEAEDTEENRTLYRKRVLQNIYGDGTNQYIYGYFIDVEYKDVLDRLRALESDSGRSLDDKLKQKRNIKMNEAMFDEMGWYPTVENFTKIMMAHFETLMHMMYKAVQDIGGRTAADLGVSIGEGGICSDVPRSSAELVPPFPRATLTTTDAKGITSVEDVWVGELTKGKGFVEADLVNGLFNGYDEVKRIYEEAKSVAEDIDRVNGNVTEQGKPVVKYPLCPTDFFTSFKPYGDNLCSNADTKQFSEAVGIRMFNTLCLNQWRKNFSIGVTELIKTFAQCEARNFYNLVALENRSFRDLIKLKNSALTSDAIIENLTGGTSPLFSKVNGKLWLTRYQCKNIDGQAPYVYPLSYQYLNDAKVLSNQGSRMYYRANVTLSSVYSGWMIDHTLTHVPQVAWFGQSMGGRTFNNARHGTAADLDTLASAASFESDGDEYKSISDRICGGSGSVVDVAKQMYDKSFSNNATNVLSKVPSVEEALSGNFNGITFKNISFSSTEQKTTITQSKADVLQAAINNGTNGISKSSVTTQQSKSSVNTVTYSKDGLGADDSSLNYRKGMTLVMSLNIIDYDTIMNDGKNLGMPSLGVVCVPKLVSLQIGAALQSLTKGGKMSTEVGEPYKSVLGSKTSRAWKYISDLSPFAKVGYMKEFRDWCNSFVPYLAKAGSVDKWTADSLTKSGILATILQPTVITKLTVNYLDNQHIKDFGLDQQQVKTYFEEFLNTLNNLYNKTDDATTDTSSSNVTTTTRSTTNTTNDMKIELYRYLKQLYDKWIPTATEDTWKMESFFTESNDKGHNFVFIDSYYNKIGDKLLINPLYLADRIQAYLESSDVASMMLGFLSDIYARNKCMLLTIQNFMDLSKQNSMVNMFTPVPYSQMKPPHEYPSFVVVYPYEPSKYLNIEDGEYADDTFMLNNEEDTPMAIRTKNVDGGSSERNGYRIPAFGVTYGRQYQSYFTNVNVDMSSPIATQQTIKAKHYILNEASKTAKAAAAQDIYDLYATQSYTCTVDMMGCAWVQPMMYFVLLNIPMFRGSYMIMSVTHRITPGNMTTTFKGCRMANVSNHIVEEVFFGEDVGETTDGSASSIEQREHELASIGNDCKYQVYPIGSDGDYSFEGVSIVNKPRYIKGNEVDQKNFTIAVYKAWLDAGVNDITAKILVMQDANESGYGSSPGNDYNFGNIINHSCEYGSRGSGTKWHKFTSMANYVKCKMNHVLNKYPGVLNATSISSFAAALKCGQQGGYAEENAKDYQDKMEGCEARVNKYLSGLKKVNNSKADLKYVYKESFFTAIQNTCLSTPTINVKLKKQALGETGLIITQADGKTDKLAYVFDVILNTDEYYQYMQNLTWVYGNGGMEGDPVSICVYVAQKVDQTKRDVTVYAVNSSRADKSPYVNTSQTFNSKTQLNKKLLTSLRQKYGTTASKEIWQFKNAMSLLGNIKIDSCGDVIGSKYGNVAASAVNPLKKGAHIDNWKVYDSVDYLVKHAKNPWHKEGQCATYVEDAIAKGGLPRMRCSDSGTKSYPKGRKYLREAAVNLALKGILDKNGFVPITVSDNNYQAGDVVIIDKGVGEYGHAVMCIGENKWISDYVQGTRMIPSSYGNNKRYYVYRYKNKPIEYT